MTKTSPKTYPVYLLYGPETYLIEEEIQTLLDQILPEKERGLNLHLFSGEEHSGREIVQAAQTVPMFSRYRFVLVKEADRLSEEDVETLSKYLNKPSPTTCLVLSAQTLGPWKGCRPAIEKIGKMVEHPRMKGKALISWMTRRMGEKGKILSSEAAEYLIDVVGDHLQSLDNMVEHAFLAVGEKRKVEVSDVEGIVSDVKVNTVFDLTDAIGQQNLEKALGILGKVIGSKIISFKKDEEVSKMDDPVPLLLSLMARQYRLIWRVKEITSRQYGVEGIARNLRMSPWTVKRLVEQGKGFSESCLREGILKCHQADLAIKRGSGLKNLLMEKLVIDLCRPGSSTSPFKREG
jgi:DNA polymerase III subunit delta